jgi:hypothetical protein
MAGFFNLRGDVNLMRRSIWIGSALAGLTLAVVALAGDLKSGPQIGDKITKPFNPLHCNGSNAGEKVCLV